MSYAKIHEDVVIKYPYDYSDLYKDNPYTNFGTNGDISNLYASTEAAKDGSELVDVNILPPPFYDANTHKISTKVAPELISGKYVLGWDILELTAEELAARTNQWRQSASCTPARGRIALSNAGFLSQVEALISSPETPSDTKIYWEYALSWERNSPMIIALATALNITDEQVDTLFKEAASVQA